MFLKCVIVEVNWLFFRWKNLRNSWFISTFTAFLKFMFQGWVCDCAGNRRPIQGGIAVLRRIFEQSHYRLQRSVSIYRTSRALRKTASEGERTRSTMFVIFHSISA